MTAPLSNEQFHERLKADPPGFSVKEESGYEPEVGAMAAVYGHERTYPGVASPQQIGGYRQEHQETLRRPEHYFGGWVEDAGTPKAETSLDASKRFMTRAEAHKFGQQNAQKAVFDLNIMKEVDVQYGPRLPYKGTGRTPEGQKQAIKQKNEAYRQTVASHQEARRAPRSEQLAAGARIGEQVWEAEQKAKKLGANVLSALPSPSDTSPARRSRR